MPVCTGVDGIVVSPLPTQPFGSVCVAATAVPPPVVTSASHAEANVSEISRAAAFIDNVSKPVSTILPKPPPLKHEKKTLPTSFVLRQSHRVANINFRLKPVIKQQLMSVDNCSSWRVMKGSLTQL